MIDKGPSIYTNNYALRGGAIYCKNCSIDMQDTKSTSLNALDGGFLYGLNKIEVQMRNYSSNSNYV